VIDLTTGEVVPRAMKPAGLLRRLPATIIDMVVYCGICALLAYPVGTDVDWTVATADPALLLDSVSDPAWVAHAAGVLGLWIALWWCYFAVGWGLVGATVGKWIMGIRIVDHQGRTPIGLSRAFLRLAAYSVSSVTLGMGHLLILLRHDRRALHDVLAGTWVVRTPHANQTKTPTEERSSTPEEPVSSEF
jgi:uncharacterized RDD family membrane protein YckC